MSHRGSILVIDDEPSIRDLTHELLTDEGYQVIAVATHDEALATMAATPFDLILSDTGGSSEGGDMARWVEPERIRAAAGDTPVIIFSAHDPQIFEQYVAHGFAGVIAKPFGLEALLTTIRAALHREERVPEPSARFA
jgi:CheY-like chemotaxis protein